MHLRFFTPAMAALVFFCGCASKPSDPFAARRKAYQRLASFLEPGMTRRQLYALLPPGQRPMAQPYLIGDIYSHSYAMDVEWYPLDQNFSLNATYRLANASEYPITPSPKISTHPTPKEIDTLLFPRSIPSRQNPNDVLLERPRVFSRSTGGIFHIPTASFANFTSNTAANPTHRAQ